MKIIAIFVALISVMQTAAIEIRVSRLVLFPVILTVDLNFSPLFIFKSGHVAFLMEDTEEGYDLTPQDFEDFTFEDIDEEKDDAATKRCIQRCGRKNARNTRAYSLCEDSCRGIMGSDYCTYAPDKSCYKHGWPSCCMRNGGANCPVNEPPCNVEGAVGRSY
jgi:hypothetical protein